MPDSTELKQIYVDRFGRQSEFHGTWYRGKDANFIPSKADLQEDSAVDLFILKGWLPKAPFIDKTSCITAFGSCFAQSISAYLGHAGYNVLGKDLTLSSHLVRFGEGIVNTFSIRQQLEWALLNKPVSDNMWFGANKEIALADPIVQAETARIIRSTDVFIITLGLSEIWYNKRTGEAFWRAIPEHLFDPTQHGFRISSTAENYQNLKQICDMIHTARPGAKIVFTLSPLPLMATFRPTSCLTANSVSKAILRVAIDELMRASADDPDLFYFPSYEIVKDFFVDPFQVDNRHPKPEVVEFVMQTFERHYCISGR